MAENKEMKVLFIKDLTTGECFKLDGLKPLDLTTEPAAPAAELKTAIPDGINIHITGSEIRGISNIEIYFKEEE